MNTEELIYIKKILLVISPLKIGFVLQGEQNQSPEIYFFCTLQADF